MDEIVKTYVAKLRNSLVKEKGFVTQIVYETKSGKLYVQMSIHEVGEINPTRIINA